MGTSDTTAISLRAALRESSAARAAVPPTATVSHHAANWGTYEVTRIHTGETPTPGLVDKVYCGDYEKQGTSGNDFRPVAHAETLSQIYARTGADIVVSGDGINSDPASINYGVTDGVQIKDGIAYHDFMSPTTYYRGHDALGFRWDGTVGFYSSKRGDTAADMVADGVRHSFCFGPALVADGVKQIIEGSATSSRQILAVMPNHDILIVSTSGVSNVHGPTYQQAADLAHSLGVLHAIPLDGGGSTQTMLNGRYLHPSSDVSGPRTLGSSFLLIRARVIGDTGTSWQRLTPENGFSLHPTEPAQFRVVDGETRFRGAMINATATGSVQAATLPWWARSAMYQRFPAMVAGNNNQYYDVDPAGPLKLSSSIQNSAPRHLSPIRYEAARP